jgi:magnesium chelatase subunit D
MREALRDHPIKRVPCTVSESRLIGGIDLTATLASNTLQWEQGLVAQAHGGTLILNMAERTERRTVAHLASCLDQGEILVAREGLTRLNEATFGLVALDEGYQEEQPEAALLERLGLHIELEGIGIRDLTPEPWSSTDIALTKGRWANVTFDEGGLEKIAAASLQLGVHSPRAMIQTAAIARVVAALHQEESVADEHLQSAIALGMLHRATQLPQAPEEQNTPPADNDPQKTDSENAGKERDQLPEDAIIEAAMATLRAAAPWQSLRQKPDHAGKLRIRPSDIRVTRYKQPKETATVFVVDASGSSALHRMAEAKGAVELLLSDCYSRRDNVALIAFKGDKAELLLPLTRSLVRAKKALAALPGGGGTPLADGVDLAHQLVSGIQRQGLTPTTVFFTDGVANVARDGSPGRTQAQAEALAAAKGFGQLGSRTLLIDSSPRPNPKARELAGALEGTYLPMPHASATGLRDVLIPQ